MYRRVIPLLTVLLVTVALCLAGCTQPPATPVQPGATTPVTTPGTAMPEVKVMYTAVGQMPALLSTDQIDGFMAWQPYAAVADESGIGKVVSYSQDLPPAGSWKDHTCDSFVVQRDLINKSPALVDTVSALIIAATDYTRDNRDEAAEISADWMFGSKEMTFGNVTVSSIDVEKASMPTIKFGTDPSPAWIKSNDLFISSLKSLGLLSGTLANATTDQTHAIIFDFTPYERGRELLAKGAITAPTDGPAKISIGYLPSDHDSMLFVALKKWQYFKEKYGAALKPRTDAPGKVDIADLIIGDKVVAEVQLVRGDAGPQLMTLLAQDNIQFAVVGTPPTIAAIDKGTPVKIVFPVQMEGSALVISQGAPVTDWDSFINYVVARSNTGKPLIIAAPLKGSIQDVQFRYALESSGVTVKQA